MKATDKYQSAYTVTELDPFSSHQPIILAYRQDGKPFNAKEGLLRIIVPGDKRHIRWIRQVESFAIRHVE